MTNEQLEMLAQEVLEDLQINDTTARTVRHLGKAMYKLSSVLGRELINDLDPEVNQNVRDYLLNYARYAYYGITNEFVENYMWLEREIQIEAGV